MSVHPDFHGAANAACWPAGLAPAGLAGLPLGHAIALAHLLPPPAIAWPESLMAETRRHLGGCLASIERALRIALEQEMGRALDVLPDPLVWPMVRARPALIGPALLAHMRLRAGLGLMLRSAPRRTGEADDPTPDQADEPGLPGEEALLRDDPGLRDTAFALILAEGMWAMAGGEDVPMRPDLPAEHHAELVWVAGAVLEAAIADHGLLAPDRAAAMVQAACAALLARHDEAQGALALADRFARQLGPMADDLRAPWIALERGRFLNFAALAARAMRMETAALLALLFDGLPEAIGALVHDLSGSPADFRLLLLALRPVRPDLADGRLIALADAFPDLAGGVHAAGIAALRAPELLRIKRAALAAPVWG